MSLEPNNPYYPTQKGLVYMAKANLIDKDNSEAKNNDLNLAKEQFDKAIQLKSDYAPARYQVAMVYQAQGNTDQEISALEDLKKLNPNDVAIQKTFQEAINVLFEKFPNVLPQPNYLPTKATE
jgi:tetratricopeptide (TPR) repeat protein